MKILTTKMPPMSRMLKDVGADINTALYISPTRRHPNQTGTGTRFFSVEGPNGIYYKRTISTGMDRWVFVPPERFSLEASHGGTS